MVSGLRLAGRGLVDALLPQTCVTCGEWIAAGTGVLCESCAAEMAALRNASYCPRCGRMMASPAIHGRGCARCAHEQFWNVAGIARIGPYQHPLRNLITRLKYGGEERNAEFAADLLAAEMQSARWAEQFAALVPVPMSMLRRVQRPCDHARLLALALSRRLGVPVATAVKRLKHTPSQTHQASRRSRFENVKGCFAVKRAGARRVAGQIVCIVDNLVTSGATLCEVSKVLRRAGAKKIYAAVIARTVLAGDPSMSANESGVALDCVP